MTKLGPSNDDPNARYTSDAYIWKSTSDVDSFFSRFNHSNGYCDGNIELSLGTCVVIQDGTYNAVWEIAGFDMEHNQTAADGTVYDNGYGICMVSRGQVASGVWNVSNNTNGGYISSFMHKQVLPPIVTKLQNVLDSHLINRNVLLSSNVTNGKSDAYTWTTAYATLMSDGQMTGNFGSLRTKYDDGEADYKLPLFNYEDFRSGMYTTNHFWTRNVYADSAAWAMWTVLWMGGSPNAGNSLGIRPMIYLR